MRARRRSPLAALYLHSDWSSDDVATLCVLLRQGCSNAEIMQAMKRSSQEIIEGIICFAARAWPGRKEDVAALRLQARSRERTYA